MTKRWSSTRSDLTKSKHHAHKEDRQYDAAFVRKILEADAAEPEAKFDNFDAMMDYLESGQED